MSKIKAIFYDFDGVIKDSTKVKTLAFYSLYLPFGREVADKAVAHHLKHGGVSRFEKFKIYHKEFLNEELNENEIQLWASRFSNLVLKEVIASSYVKGAKESILGLTDKVQQFIVTGTPQNEIDLIIKELGIAYSFRQICGSPKNKIDWSTELLSIYGFKNDEVLFIGDALTDYEAAEHHGFNFLLRTHEENQEYFKGIETKRRPDLTDLTELLQEY